MARHRSPSGRRAHLGSPLSLSFAAAGAGGGAGGSISLPQFPKIPAQRLPEGVSQLTSSLPVRFVATVLAGGAVAAAGQQVLADALPRAAEGANVLRLGVENLMGAPRDVQVEEAAAVLTYEAVAVAPVAPAPAVATADDLVKAADLQKAAAEAAAEVAAQATAKAAAAAKAAEVAKAIPRGARGGIQMLVGAVTSGFGGRWGGTHQGLDIAAPIGTPIRVPLGGTVISSGPADGFGMWVRVRHSDGTITLYGHINRSLVSVGQQVAAGDVIAEVGNRGQSTGPHLHIGVQVNGSYVDPRAWLDRNGIGY